MKDRLDTKTDILIITLIWIIYIGTFLSLLFLSSIYSGIEIAFRFGLFFAIFPFGLSLGAVADRHFAKESISKGIKQINKEFEEKKSFNISIEDILRLIIILTLTFIALPWIAALFGIEKILFFERIHVGEQHGYYGYLLILFALLNTKIIKYNKDSIAREIIIFGFTFFGVYGAGLLIDDFLIEQLNLDINFYIPFYEGFDLFTIFIQLFIILLVSLVIYYVFWRKIYYPKIKIIQDF